MLRRTEPTVQVGNFEPAFPPLNPRLLDLYSVADDRLGLIHACANARRLRNGELLRRDMPYFGGQPAAGGLAGRRSTTCRQDDGWCPAAEPVSFSLFD